MNLPRWIRLLLVPALLLPMLLAVLFGLMGLLTAIDDTAGASVVCYIGWTCLVLWMVDLAALAIASAAVVALHSDSFDYMDE